MCSASREGSGPGVVEGDGAGELPADEIGGIDVAFDGVVEASAGVELCCCDGGAEGIAFIDGARSERE